MSVHPMWSESDEHPVMQFAKAVLHGNEEHREWLLEAAQCFIEGKPLPERRG
jgi:hypothetical protein